MLLLNHEERGGADRSVTRTTVEALHFSIIVRRG